MSAETLSEGQCPTKARRMIARLRAEAEQKDLRGFLGLIDLGEGRLLAHQGKTAPAREVLARICRFLDAAGVEHVPAPVAALAAEIEGGRPSRV